MKHKNKRKSTTAKQPTQSFSQKKNNYENKIQTKKSIG